MAKPTTESAPIDETPTESGVVPMNEQVAETPEKKTRKGKKKAEFNGLLVYTKQIGDDPEAEGFVPAGVKLYVGNKALNITVVDFNHDFEVGEGTYGGADVSTLVSEPLKDAPAQARNSANSFAAGADDTTIAGYVFSVGTKIIILDSVSTGWVDENGPYTLSAFDQARLKRVPGSGQLWDTANGKFGSKYALKPGKDFKGN